MLNTVHDLSVTAKAVFGAPVGEVSHSANINPATAEFALLGALFEEWVNDAYKRNEVVAGSLNLIINTFLEAPLGVQDLNGEWLDEHDTKKLFAHINEDTSYREFISTLLLHLFLGSVAFVEKVRDSKGKLTEIGLLRPDKVKLTKHTHGISHYTYFPSTKPIDISKENILFLKFIDPMNKYAGHSPLHSLATRIDTENEATRLTKASLQNMGAPGTIITFEGRRSDEEKRAAALSFNNRFKGDNSGSTLAIDEDIVSISPFGASVGDRDLSTLMSVDEARILSTLHIPLSVYGSISGQEASTFDNMKTSLRMFWMHNLIPLQSMVEDFFNNDPDFTDNFTVKIKFDRREIDALNQDQTEVSTRAREDFKANIISLNEARKAGEYAEVADGDEINKPQVFDFGSFGNDGADEDEAKAIRSNRLEKLNAFYEDQLSKNDKDIQKDDSEGCDCADTIQDTSDAERENTEILQSPTNDRDLRSEYEIATKRFALADAAALSLVRLVDRELNAQIKEFTGLIGTKSAKALKTFEQSRLEDGLSALEQQWELRMYEESLAVMSALHIASAQQAAASIGSSFDIEQEAVKQAIKAEQFKFADKVSKTSAKQIRAVIAKSFDEGKTLGELTTDIEKLGKAWQGARAETIAKTETAKAANNGAKIAYKQSGVTKLIYSAVLDDRTTEICRSLDGKIVGIEESFLTQEEGFVDSKGKSMDLSYNDGVPNAGSAHPNCRSVVIAVTDNIKSTEIPLDTKGI